MMHGVATTATTTSTTTTTNNQNNSTNPTNNCNLLNQAANKAAMLQQESHNMTPNPQGALGNSPGGPNYLRQDSLNFGIKLKETQSSLVFNEQQQRKLEMLESRFVPLNTQKVDFTKIV